MQIVRETSRTSPLKFHFTSLSSPFSTLEYYFETKKSKKRKRKKMKTKKRRKKQKNIKEMKEILDSVSFDHLLLKTKY